jgi:hypothetical protein
MRGIVVLLWFGLEALAQQSELLEAARSGRTKQVETALANGAAIDAPDARGRTALMLAAENGQASTVRLLLDKGADPEVRDSHGWNAYMFALLASSGEAVRAHEAVLKLLPQPPRYRISVNAMWAPADSGFQSCSLKPEALAQEMRQIRPDGLLLEAFRRFAIANGRDLIAIVQADALGTSEVPNKIAREDVDATVTLIAQPEVTCGYQADRIAFSVRAEVARGSGEPRVITRAATRSETAANPRQYAPVLAERVKSEAGAVYWGVVAALMERR